MRKYVFTVKDDVCALNSKDVNATELIEVMKLYGSVEDFDRVIASVKAEYQATVDSLTAQNEAIKAFNLTDDEYELIVAYRACKGKIEQKHLNRIDALENELVDIKNEEQIRCEKIMALFQA